MEETLPRDCLLKIMKHMSPWKRWGAFGVAPGKLRQVLLGKMYTVHIGKDASHVEVGHDRRAAWLIPNYMYAYTRSFRQGDEERMDYMEYVQSDGRYFAGPGHLASDSAITLTSYYPDPVVYV